MDSDNPKQPVYFWAKLWRTLKKPRLESRKSKRVFLMAVVGFIGLWTYALWPAELPEVAACLGEVKTAYQAGLNKVKLLNEQDYSAFLASYGAKPPAYLFGFSDFIGLQKGRLGTAYMIESARCNYFDVYPARSEAEKKLEMFLLYEAPEPPVIPSAVIIETGNLANKGNKIRLVEFCKTLQKTWVYLNA